MLVICFLLRFFEVASLLCLYILLTLEAVVLEAILWQDGMSCRSHRVSISRSHRSFVRGSCLNIADYLKLGTPSLNFVKIVKVTLSWPKCNFSIPEKIGHTSSLTGFWLLTIEFSLSWKGRELFNIAVYLMLEPLHFIISIVIFGRITILCHPDLVTLLFSKHPWNLAILHYRVSDCDHMTLEECHLNWPKLPS